MRQGMHATVIALLTRHAKGMDMTCRKHLLATAGACLSLMLAGTVHAQSDKQWKADGFKTPAEEAEFFRQMRERLEKRDAMTPKRKPATVTELLRDLATPSPTREVWTRFNEGLDSKTAPLVEAALKARPKPTRRELDAALAKVRQDMLPVAGGKFVFGDFGLMAEPFYSLTDDEAGPPYLAILSDYQINKHRVTYADYDIYTRNRRLPPITTDQFRLEFRYPDYPAHVTWRQARDYCQWLADTTAQPYALPTEAQWEYAARSRGKNYAWGTAIADEDNVKVDPRAFASKLEAMAETLGGPDYLISGPVGLFGANPFGMYDVIGYGEEWVYDYFARHPGWEDGKPLTLTNPRGPVSGSERVVKQASHGPGALTVTRLGGGEKTDMGSTVTHSFRCAINATR